MPGRDEPAPQEPAPREPAPRDPPRDPAPDPHRPVRLWLWINWAMILAMVAIGGVTRLTESGLSMVTWQPLIGAVPPLSEADWLAVFAEYQRTPQYQAVNLGMTLPEFKAIFFWEYLHRLWGRLIGVVFFVPWLWFTLRGRLRGALRWKTGLAFVLGGLQGALGWYMVKSGLVDVPAVSHYRLAAHLSLAFVVGCWVWWVLADLRHPEPLVRDTDARARLRRVWIGFMILLSAQIILGAFMAGKRAGLLFATWPDMNGHLVPPAMSLSGAWWRDLAENPITIHFAHRTLGYVVALLGAGLGLLAHRWLPRTRAAAAGRWLVLALMLQVLLGIATVVWGVPVAVATAHQVLALLLLTTAVSLRHALR